MCKKTGNKTLSSRTLNLLGVCCRTLGYYDKSLAYLSLALVNAEETGNKIEVGFAENNIGSAYRQKAYYKAAMQHVLRGLSFFESVNYKFGIAYSNITIGFIYQDQQNYSKALEFFNKAYQLRSEIQDTVGVGNVLAEIGKTYALCGNYSEAMKKFKEAETTFARVGDNAGMMNIWSGIGGVYLKQKKYPEALNYYVRSYQTAEQIASIRGKALNGRNIGSVYANMKRFDEAEQYLRRALEISESLNEYVLVLDCYHAFANFYELKRDFSHALLYERLYSELKDSVLSRENISGVSEMDAVYQNEKAKTENALLHKNIELSTTQRNFGIVLSLLFICISAVVYWKYRYQRRMFTAEEGLRESRRHYQQLFENSYMGIFHADPDGKFRRSNQALAAMFGHGSPAEFIAEMKDLDSMQIYLADADTTSHKPENWVNAEKTYTTKDGSLLTAKLTIRKELNSDGSVAYIEGIMDDITLRKQNEAEIRRINEELKELNATKDKFFSIIAHDLRSPFQVLLGFSEILSQDIEQLSQEEVKKLSKELHETIEKQYALLTDLLDWAKLQRSGMILQPKPLSVCKEVQSVIDSLAVTASLKRVVVESEIPDECSITADPNMLQLVLRNLISNSLKFTRQGGKIKINATVSVPFVEMSVEDNGVGISETDIANLFRSDVLLSTEGTAKEKGTGLGLVLCKEIVEKHGGHISVASKPGKGSKFSFTVPTA